MKRKILVLNHFPTISPPNTGGVLRYFHIYKELSTFFDITLLSQKYTPSVEYMKFTDTFREYKIPLDPIQQKIDDKLINGSIGPRFSTHAALSCALMHSPPPTFKTYYNKYYKKSDIIVFESPFMLHYDMNWGSDTKPRIYNSHNLESEFAKRIWHGKHSRKYVTHIVSMEKKLVEQSTIMFATSKEEKMNFVKTFHVDPQKIKLSPNGVIPEYWAPRHVDESGTKRKKVLFIGSMHEPNLQIVEFIISKLSKECSSMNFIIAGACGNNYSHLKLKNVEFLGEVDDEEKKKLFSTANIAINPAFYGTGTKIKTLEFLSAGIPLISTPTGVQGMRLTKDIHYVSASSQTFSSVLKKSLQDPKKLRELAREGQQFVNQNYSWRSIAEKMKKELERI